MIGWITLWATPRRYFSRFIDARWVLIHCRHYLPRPLARFMGLAAARLVAYAIATACLTGLPALTSARTLERKASLLVDFLSGMITSLS
jgi:hypothetical protein